VWRKWIPPKGKNLSHKSQKTDKAMRAGLTPMKRGKKILLGTQLQEQKCKGGTFLGGVGKGERLYLSTAALQSGGFISDKWWVVIQERKKGKLLPRKL